MNFQELGLTLQREREAKGLTIAAVMEATKISRINLVAIESGDRTLLPHPVYTKGFIKSYARLLGLDADELSMVVDREYLSEAQEAEEASYDVSPAAEKAFQDADAPVKRNRTVWLSIIIFLVIAVAVVLIVFNLNEGGDKPDSAAGSAPVIEQQAAPAEQAVEPKVEPVPEASPAGEAAPAVETLEAVPEAAAPVEGEQPDSVGVISEQEPPDGQEAVEDSIGEVVQVVDQDAVHYDHVLIIRAITDKGCWVGLWKGDEPNMARDFVLKKGEPLRLMFNNPRRIRIGNVAGVRVTYNGRPYPLEDNKSNIQTLVFGAN